MLDFVCYALSAVLDCMVTHSEKCIIYNEKLNVFFKSNLTCKHHM